MNAFNGMTATSVRAATAGVSAFQRAASNPFAGGKTCMTGLLNASPQNQYLCDKHPSQSGHQLLSAVVEALDEE